MTFTDVGALAFMSFSAVPVFGAMNFPEFQTTEAGSAMLDIQRDPNRLTDFVRSLGRNPRRQTRFGFWLCSWLLFLCFLCIPLYGIDRDRSLDQLYHTSWTYAEGA